jgi:hypothetical protein
MFAMSPIRSEYVDVQTSNNSLYAAVTSGVGTPGAAIPTTGIMFGGSDGTNFLDAQITAAGTSATNGLAMQGVTGGVPMPTVGSANVTEHDCSGTGTGSSQVILAASANVHGLTIANIDPANGVYWITFTAGAAAAATVGNFPLAAPTATTYTGAGSYTTPNNDGFNGTLRGIGTAGLKFSCKWW